MRWKLRFPVCVSKPFFQNWKWEIFPLSSQFAAGGNEMIHGLEFFFSAFSPFCFPLIFCNYRKAEESRKRYIKSVESCHLVTSPALLKFGDILNVKYSRKREG